MVNLKNVYDDLLKSIIDLLKSVYVAGKILATDIIKKIVDMIVKCNTETYKDVEESAKDTFYKTYNKLQNDAYYGHRSFSKLDYEIRYIISEVTDLSFIDDIDLFPAPNNEKAEKWNSDKVKQAVKLSFSLGENEVQLYQRVSKVIQMNYTQMMMRSKTLVNAMRNYAYQKFMEEVDKYVDVKKEWVDMEDSRVRFSHKHKYGCGGQIVKVDERFKNGLLYPCEFGMPWKEVANCRCQLRMIIGGVHI